MTNEYRHHLARNIKGFYRKRQVQFHWTLVILGVVPVTYNDLHMSNTLYQWCAKCSRLNPIQISKLENTKIV